ncbi:MAG: DNA-formamidopyrimidine glycosylase [Mycoplasmataceae bacterium]|nr:DNA-formamidopyrimidine glycosylase [Mycoplasmataceae bacterium]
MPELPEVQTVINLLKAKKLIGLRISDVNVIKSKLLKNVSILGLKKATIGAKITSLNRIGKNIIINLSNKKSIVIHLRMEGKLFLEGIKPEWNTKHLMLEFILTQHKVLRYYDTRMFGTLHVYDQKNLLNQLHIKKIAIDPLNVKFNGEYLKKAITNKNKPIKTCLLDQTLVSGIGNIYCDEILFAAKIHPLTKPKDIKNFNVLAQKSTEILKKAIKLKGTTVFSYHSAPNTSGSFQKYLAVYGRTHQKCVRCKTMIKKIVVGGRGTYFCPNCQRL